MNSKISALLLSLCLAAVATPTLADDGGGCATKKQQLTHASMNDAMDEPMDGPMDGYSHGNDVHAGMGMPYPKDTDILMDAMVPDNIEALLTSQKIEIVGSLALSDDQQQKIDKLSSKMRESNRHRISQITGFAEQLHKLYAQPERNANSIDQNFKQIFDLKREMIGEVINTENQVYAVLSEKQRNTLLANNPAFNAMH